MEQQKWTNAIGATQAKQRKQNNANETTKTKQQKQSNNGTWSKRNAKMEQQNKVATAASNESNSVGTVVETAAKARVINTTPIHE